MKFNKLVLAMSLVGVTSIASAGSLVTPFTPSAVMGDAIILQTQVSSGVQLGVSVQSGVATAVTYNCIQPTAEITPLSSNGIDIVVPNSTVSHVAPPLVSVYGSGTASALVTQDALALVVVPTSAINTIATLVNGPI